MPSSAWIPHRFYLLNFCDDFSSLPFAPISASIQFACANGRGKVIKFSENNFPFFPVSHSRRKSQRRRVAIHIKCEENKTEIITNHNEVYSTPQTVVILCKNVCHSKGKLLSILFIFFIWLLFICPLAGWCVLVPKKLLWSTQYKTKMNSFGFIARWHHTLMLMLMLMLTLTRSENTHTHSYTWLAQFRAMNFIGQNSFTLDFSTEMHWNN